jgi:hypothetical protein
MSSYGDWMPRGGDNVILTVEGIDYAGGAADPTLNVVLFHKNAEDAGDGTQVGSTISFTGLATRFKHVQVTGLKEIVRIRVQCVSAEPEPAARQWYHFRVLTPVWYDSST